MAIKRIFFALTAIFLFINISAVSDNNNCKNLNYSRQSSLDYWNWEPYASLSIKGKTLIVLYYGIRSKGYNGQVKWKLKNFTKKTLYNIAINNVEYTLSNNEKVKIQKHNFINYYVYSGKTNYTKPDNVNNIRNNKLQLETIKIEAPEIFFALSKDGKIYDWNKLGKVEIEYDN